MVLHLIGSSEQVDGLGAAFSDRINNNSDHQVTLNKRLRKRKTLQCQDDDIPSPDNEITTRAIEVPLSHICPPPLAFPKSAYSGSLPFVTPSTETSVLREILVSLIVSSASSAGWLTT